MCQQIKIFSLLSIAASIFSLAACRSRSDSRLNVIRGVVTIQFPYVVKLDPPGCTAVFVGTHTALTAHHCLRKEGVAVKFGDTEHRPEKLVFAEGSKDNKFVFDEEDKDDFGVRVPEQDLAILIFDKNVELNIPATSLSKHAIARGQKVVVVGFGHTKLQHGKADFEKQKKHFGYNFFDNERYAWQSSLETEHLKKGVILLRGTEEGKLGENVVPLSGDSGGPLLSAADNTVLGIAANGTIRKEDLGDGREGLFGFYVDLCSPFSRKLLKEAISKGAQIDDRSCD